MAADVGQAYCGWAPAPELAEQQEARELSVSDDEFSSFGSFKFDSLDWEKRSVFTRNRCLEELEKFKTPGLVARKKAFFEERYNKIRAQKAMGENQQRILDDGSACCISNQVKYETSVHEKQSCENIQIQNTSSTFLSSKAMGENQQLILDDGSACSISNQVKDETSVHEKQSCEDIQIQNTASTFLSSNTMGESQQLILDDGGARSISNQVKDETSVHEKQSCEDIQIQNTSSTFLSSKAMRENQQLILDDGSARSISNQVKDETSMHEKQSCEDIQIQNTSSTFLSSKAMRENQQLILDDGSARSISNQVKDETSMHEKQSCEDTQIQNTSSTFLSSKAMGENQQLILDEGGARSISNQVKDETSMHEKQSCEDIQIQNTSSIFVSSKAMRENQQLILDDGSARSISNQVKDETSVHEKQSCEDIQIQNTSSSFLSSTAVWLDVSKETADDCYLHLQGLDSEVSMLESLKRTEVIEPHTHMNIDERDTLRRTDNSELTAQLEKVSSGAEVQIHQRDTPVTGLPSLVQAELVEESQFSGHDAKDTTMKNRVLKSNEDLATAGTVIHHSNSDAVKSDDKDMAMKNCISESYVDLATAVTVIHHVNSDAVKSDSGIAQEKAKSHARKQKGNAAVTKLMKGPVSSARYVLKVDFKSQTITSQPPKHHSQQLGPSNATSDKVSRNIRSSTVASQKPLTGACSKSTIPVPVSFGTERRTRDNALKSQDAAWKAARTCSVNNGESEDKRGSEQIPKKRPTSSRGRVANLHEPPKNLKIGDLEYKRGSGQVKESRPTSHRGRLTNLSEPLNQKSKEMENNGVSDEVREKRPTSCLGRPVNIKDQKSEGIVNRRDSEQDRGKRGLIREPLKDQKSSTRENKRCSELVREKILPGGPMLRAVKVPEPPKEKRSKGSENLRDSEQVRERALPKVTSNVSDSNAKISRSVNLLAQYRSTVAVRKNEPNEVSSSRADPFSHKGKRPLSGSRSQNGTLPRQEMRPWR